MSSGIRGKKRDRLRGFVGRLTKERLSASTELHVSKGITQGNRDLQGSTIPSSAPLSQSSNLSEEFYIAVLEKLEAEDRSIIKEHVTHNINDAVQAAYVAASKQKEIYEDQKWSGSDKANKVLLWIDRFKSVGDIAANANPVHIGLPWAGIRVLLEAAVADSRQMIALMSGMDLALCNANRLQAYMTYFQCLPPSLTTDNLQKALVALYAHVLWFLAEAIRTYSVNTTTRKVLALWRNSDLVTFEDRCDKLGERVSIEANNCDRELRARERTEEAQWKHDLEVTLRTLDNIRSVEASLDALRVKVDLSKLLRVQQATYNSSAEEKLSLCLDGTRSEILHDITHWAGKPDSEFMFWLCGKAGTGKSTISRTIAQRFDKQQCLGASFFFKRGEKNRSNADHFFSTIAGQLADLLPHMQVSVAAALEKDSFLCGRGLQEQFEKLLLQPLLNIDPAHVPRHSIMIVIDALDECDRNTDMRMFLRLLTRLKTESVLRLHVFMTSRPELPVHLGVRQLDGILHRDIVLEEAQERTIRRDIRTYFDSEFAKLKEDRLLLRPNDALPVDWPSNDDIQILVDLAVPLFIFASTVCRFVSDSNPKRRLKVILEQRYSAGSSHLAKLYLPILDQLLIERDEEERREILSEFREVIGPIILAADPISITSLANLLTMDKERIQDILERLHSVLRVPSSLHDPVQLLHQSFRDFLIDQRRKDEGGLWINENETHKRLAHHCLRLLQESQKLRSDICCVKQPGFRRSDLATQQIAIRIPADIVYACSHWPWHLVKSGEQLCDNDQVHHFLRSHFLHWLEVLSWVGRLSGAITQVEDLLHIAKGKDCREVANFLTDAKRFILSNRLAADLAPLQLYHSALVFTPRESIVRNAFQAESPTSWSLLPNTPLHWSAEILKLEGHNAAITAVAFSPDGRVMATASSDQTLRLWDTQTGKEEHKLKIAGHAQTLIFSIGGQLVGLGSMTETALVIVQFWNAQTGEQIQSSGVIHFCPAAAVTPDGQIIAITSAGWSIYLFDGKTGSQTYCLEGHISMIVSLLFSPDGQVVASGSADGTIQLWNVTSGERIHILRRHTDQITGMAFAPNGQVVASASNDSTLQLWHTQTGEQICELKGHDGDYITLAFSYDGKTVASRSDDQTVRFWDAETGKQTFTIRKNEREDDYTIPVMAMSPVARIVAIAIHDQTLQLWNTQTGKCTQRLEGHNGIINAATFSPDGQVVASASSDRTTQLWDVQTGVRMRKFEAQNGSLFTIAFSHDGKIVASASDDQIIYLWDTQTGDQTLMITEDTGTVPEIVFSLEGQVITWASLGGGVQIWDPQTGKRIYEPTIEYEDTREMVFSPNSKAIAIGSDNGTLRLWNVEGSEQLRKLKGNNQEISAIAYSPDGQIVASASRDGTVQLWNTQACEQILMFKVSEERETIECSVVALTFSPDGQVLAVSLDQVVQLWDTQMGKEILTLKGGNSAIAFSPDGQFLAVSYGRMVQLWNIQTVEQRQEFEGHTDLISALAFSPDGQLVASASQDGTARLWNTRSSDKTHNRTGHEDQVTAVDCSPDGKTVVSASRDRTVRLWDMQTGKEIKRFQKHNHEVSAVAFSPDGKSIASLSWHTIWLWDAQTGKEIQRLPEHEAQISAMAFSPDGRIIASASTYLSRTIWLWSTQTGKQIHEFIEYNDDFHRHHTLAKTMIFSPDGQFVASMSSTLALLLWNTQTGEKIRVLETDPLYAEKIAMTFSPDSQVVASLVIDTKHYSRVQLWNIETGECLQRLELPGGIPTEISTSYIHNSRAPSGRSVYSTTFSRDGKCVHTDTGTYVLEWTPSGLLVDPPKRTTALEVSGQWIRYQGQDLLYLPYDFQGKCATTYGKTLVIGQASGAVTFFRIK